MNDEELKGMVVNNTPVPLQDGLTFDSSFETPREEVNGESSALSPASSVKSSVLESDSEHRTTDVFSAENNLAASTGGIAPSNLDAGKETASLDAEADNLIASIMQDKVLKNDVSVEPELPQVTIEDPNQFSVSNGVNEENISGMSSGEMQVESPAELVSHGMDVQAVNAELPQVSIEDPNQFPVPNEVNGNVSGIPSGEVQVVPPAELMGHEMDAQAVNAELSQVSIEDPNQFPVPNEVNGNVSGMPSGEIQVEPPVGLVNHEMGVQTAESELPQVTIENPNQFDSTYKTPILASNNASNLMNTTGVDFNANTVTPLGADVLLDEAFQTPTQNNTINVSNGTGVSEVVPAIPTESDLANMVVQTTPIQENIPNMQANPNIEPSIHLSNDMNDSDEYQETPYYMTEEAPKTKEDLELEKRNSSGIRFIIIFGLIVLIFIILLPYISGLL